MYRRTGRQNKRVMATVFDSEPGAPLRIFPYFVGAGRSGTTLLRAMFDSHPEIAIPNESGFIVRLARERHRYESAHLKKIEERIFAQVTAGLRFTSSPPKRDTSANS